MPAAKEYPAKYEQIINEMVRRIETGEYGAEQKIPSEQELIREFDVSRPTVVAAMRSLTERGWIYPRQGKGRFVRKLLDPDKMRDVVRIERGHVAGLISALEIVAYGGRVEITQDGELFAVILPAERNGA